MTGNETVYHKFTPFYNKAKSKKVAKPRRFTYSNLFSGSVKGAIKLPKLKNKFVCKKIKNITNYQTSRNELSVPTTQLSAYIKFGIYSIRQVFHSFKNTALKRQLYWRDFYYNLAFENPKIFSGQPFRGSRKSWPGANKIFTKWKQGKTGYPVVDAAMRQLNETGHMHNRGRLITANFLVKLGLVDWRKGEKYFATKLIDYDPAINNGNWQWVAGTGVDYENRIYNPFTQGKNYDKECKYIKKWVPELKDVDPKEIHKGTYGNAIFDYKKQRGLAVKWHK